MADQPSYPALVASHAGIWLAEAGGEVRRIGRGDAIRRAADTPLILLNAPLTATRLGYPELSGMDLLELFAFVHPARFAVPTAPGLAADHGPRRREGVLPRYSHLRRAPRQATA